MHLKCQKLIDKDLVEGLYESFLTGKSKLSPLWLIAATLRCVH
jgi:hypothetical protein